MIAYLWDICRGHLSSRKANFDFDKLGTPHTLSVQSIASIVGARFLKEKFKEIHSFL